MPASIWRLWGRDADYVLSDTAERPEGAIAALPMPHGRAVEDLLIDLVGLYPGNLDILRDALQRTSAAADRDLVQAVASRVAAGFHHLWQFPHPRLDVPTNLPEIPRLSDFLERQGESEVTTWVGVRVVDQYGRELPWMRARLGVPDGRVFDRPLDADARTGADRLPQAGVCWLELQAERATKSAGPFVDAVEPPRPAATEAASWVGIRVVDQYGRPLPWMQARMRLPDAAERQPVLDPKGRTRIDAVTGGACSLELQASAPPGVTPS